MRAAKNPRRSWKEPHMIFREKEKRTGKTFIVCSMFWPDRTRFRRRYPNKTIATQVMNRIIASKALGTWRDLKRELTDGPEDDYTIEEFGEVYLEEYCKIRNTRPDFRNISCDHPLCR